MLQPLAAWPTAPVCQWLPLRIDSWSRNFMSCSTARHTLSTHLSASHTGVSITLHKHSIPSSCLFRCVLLGTSSAAAVMSRLLLLPPGLPCACIRHAQMHGEGYSLKVPCPAHFRNSWTGDIMLTIGRGNILWLWSIDSVPHMYIQCIYNVIYIYIYILFQHLCVFIGACQWFGAGLWWLQCISNGVTAVSHWAIDMYMSCSL